LRGSARRGQEERPWWLRGFVIVSSFAEKIEEAGINAAPKRKKTAPRLASWSTVSGTARKLDARYDITDAYRAAVCVTAGSGSV